jgi:cardiolipin synthase (CMP-forming)
VKRLPNLLSAARLALAPWLFSLLWRRQYGAALMVIFVAGVTDGLDGLIARNFGAASKLGAYLDPVDDKVLLSGTFLTLAIDGAVAKWLAVLVLGRDALILIFACVAFLFTEVRSFPPSIWGKASTAAQILYILVLLAHFDGLLAAILVRPFEYLTVWSFLHYAWTARRMFHHTASS